MRSNGQMFKCWKQAYILIQLDFFSGMHRTFVRKKAMKIQTGEITYFEINLLKIVYIFYNYQIS